MDRAYCSVNFRRVSRASNQNQALSAKQRLHIDKRQGDHCKREGECPLVSNDQLTLVLCEYWNLMATAVWFP